jgi:CIC family chloride channel protein
MAKSRTAKASSAARAARENPYVNRLIEDDELRDNIRSAYQATRSAYGRLSNGKGPTKALMEDKKLHRELREAANALRDAGTALRDGPKRKRGGLGRKLFVLAIGAGLALGREGPSVQMGASIANVVGTLARRTWPDARALLAAGAGAGLAAAFNAPTAGAVFVLEELVRKFEPRMAIAAVAASSGTIFVSRMVLGDAPDFHVGAMPYPAAATMPLYLALGIAAGLLAAGYNWMILGAIAGAAYFKRCPVELRAGLIGAAVGALAWFAPDLVGGGDALTQSALDGTGTLAVLPLILILRAGLGAVSYAAGTPGGLFAPLLVLGAQLGLCFGMLGRMAFPAIDIAPEGFAVVGMAAVFAGVVRAPVTGITLVVEMTANITLLLPMLAACFVAMLVPTMLGNAPIYDSLRERPALKPAGTEAKGDAP